MEKKRIASVFENFLILFLFPLSILTLFNGKTVWIILVGVCVLSNVVFICRSEHIEFLDQVADLEQIWKPLTYEIR